MLLLNKDKMNKDMPDRKVYAKLAWCKLNLYEFVPFLFLWKVPLTYIWIGKLVDRTCNLNCQHSCRGFLESNLFLKIFRGEPNAQTSLYD